MTGVTTDAVVKIEGAPGCSFCKSARNSRAYFFVNPARDVIVCDVCVTALFARLSAIGDPDPYRPKGRPN